MNLLDNEFATEPPTEEPIAVWKLYFFIFFVITSVCSIPLVVVLLVKMSQMCCTSIRKRLEKADAKWTAKVAARTTLVPASPTSLQQVVPGMEHPSSRRRQLQELTIMTSTPVTTPTTAAKKQKPTSRLLSFFKTAKTTATTTHGNRSSGTAVASLPTTNGSTSTTTRIKSSSWPGMIRGSWLASKPVAATTTTSTTAVTLAVGGINDGGSEGFDDVDIEITAISPRSSPSARDRIDRSLRPFGENEHFFNEDSENSRSSTPPFNIDHPNVNTNRRGRGRGRGRRHRVDETPTETPEPQRQGRQSSPRFPRRTVRFAEELEETRWISPYRSPESSPSEVEIRPAASAVGILRSSSPVDSIGNMLRYADFLTSERTEDARGYKGRMMNQLSSLSKQMKKLQKQAKREQEEQEAAAAAMEEEASFEERDYRDEQDESGGRRGGAASAV